MMDFIFNKGQINESSQLYLLSSIDLILKLFVFWFFPWAKLIWSITLFEAHAI